MLLKPMFHMHIYKDERVFILLLLSFLFGSFAFVNTITFNSIFMFFILKLLTGSDCVQCGCLDGSEKQRW